MDGSTRTAQEWALATVSGQGWSSLIEKVENLIVLSESSCTVNCPLANTLHTAAWSLYTRVLGALPDDATDPGLATQVDPDALRAMGQTMLELVEGMIASPPASLYWFAALAHDKSAKHHLVDGLFGRIMMRSRLALVSGQWAARPKRSDTIDLVCDSEVETTGVIVDGRFLPEALVCPDASTGKEHVLVLVVRTVHEHATSLPRNERAVREAFEADPNVVQPVYAFTQDRIDYGWVNYDRAAKNAVAFMRHADELEDQIDNLLILSAVFPNVPDAPDEPLAQVVLQFTVGLLQGLVPHLMGASDPKAAWGQLHDQAFASLVANTEQFLDQILDRDPTHPILRQLLPYMTEDDVGRFYFTEMLSVHALARLLTVIEAGAWPEILQIAEGNPAQVASIVYYVANPLIRPVWDDDDDQSMRMQCLDGWIMIPPRSGEEFADAHPAATLVLSGSDRRNTSTKNEFFAVTRDLHHGAYDGAPGVRLDDEALSTQSRPLIY